MTYTYENIDDIYYSTSRSWPLKRKIDTLFEIGATIETNLGIDSTIEEKRIAKRQQRHIYETIYKLDKNTGELILKNFEGVEGDSTLLEGGD